MTNEFADATIDRIKDKLLKWGETIAVAESVTAGQLQAALSLAENARRFFQGGITVYNIGQKCRQLKVEPVHALEVNGVSEQVARQMAIHVAELFCCPFGVSITGYAAPVPEKNVRQPFAWFAVSRSGEVLCCERLEGAGNDPLAVRLDYVRRILEALDEVMATTLK
jgi:nicotinamide-nucleotide amidase